MLLNDLPVAARGSGLAVWEAPGWIGRNHGPMSAVRGVVCHHTGSSGSGAWTVVRDGRSDLPGPLAQMTLERDGSVRVLSNGQCWHAGTGSWPSIGRNNGNAFCLGIECVYNGGDITPAQRNAYPRLVAALCRHYRIPVGNVIGHREWAPGRKTDPGQIDMPTFRRDVAVLVSGAPAPPPQPPAPPRPKRAPEMIERQIVPSANDQAGRIVCPVGSASATVARAWFSASIAHGARVEAWFQRAKPGSNDLMPGAGKPVDWTLRNADRAWVEVPSGTEVIEYLVHGPAGPGSLSVELAPK